MLSQAVAEIRSCTAVSQLPPLLPILDDMDGWTKLQSGIAGLNIGQSANKFAKGFQSSVQATRERLGQVAPEEITELPQGAPSLLPDPRGVR